MNLKPYVCVVDKRILTDSSLSCGAKGLACYFYTKEDNYHLTLTEILTENKITYIQLKEYIKELEENKYIKEFFPDGSYKKWLTKEEK